MTGPASTSSPLCAAISLISFMSAHGNVSSIPNRTPIRFLAMLVALSRARRAGILAEAATSRNRAALDSAAHETRIRLVEELRARRARWSTSGSATAGAPSSCSRRRWGASTRTRTSASRARSRTRSTPGWLQLVCVDSVDEESWYNKKIHAARPRPAPRRLRPLPARRDAPVHREPRTGGNVVTVGASFGAYHAANLAGRYPGRVTKAICFSGLYDVSRYLDGYWDDTLLLPHAERLHREHGRRLEREAARRRVGRRDRREGLARSGRTATSRRFSRGRARGSRRSSGPASSATTGRSGRSTSGGSSDRGQSRRGRRRPRSSLSRFSACGALLARLVRLGLRPEDALDRRERAPGLRAERREARRLLGDLERVLEVAAPLEKPREGDADLPRLRERLPSLPRGARPPSSARPVHSR